MVDNSPQPKTVKFNVGGVYYEASRALIECNPDTMLARLISDTWQNDPDATIFIDRDGEQFRHVLSYMRDKKVHLPVNVSKAAFLQDLDYFGFVDVEADAVCDGKAVFEIASKLSKCRQESKLEITRSKKKAVYMHVANCAILSYIKDGDMSNPIIVEADNEVSITEIDQSLRNFNLDKTLLC
jgi:hypothetical protein